MPAAAAMPWQLQLASRAETLRRAVQVAGAIGDPQNLSWLIEKMADRDLARVAGEAFTTITGIDIAYHSLDGDRPEGFEPGPNDDANDSNVAMDPDENLPYPDLRLVSEWWARNRHSF